MPGTDKINVIKDQFSWKVLVGCTVGCVAIGFIVNKMRHKYNRRGMVYNLPRQRLESSKHSDCGCKISDSGLMCEQPIGPSKPDIILSTAQSLQEEHIFSHGPHNTVVKKEEMLDKTVFIVRNRDSQSPECKVMQNDGKSSESFAEYTQSQDKCNEYSFSNKENSGEYGPLQHSEDNESESFRKARTYYRRLESQLKRQKAGEVLSAVPEEGTIQGHIDYNRGEQNDDGQTEIDRIPQDGTKSKYDKIDYIYMTESKITRVASQGDTESIDNRDSNTVLLQGDSYIEYDDKDDNYDEKTEISTTVESKREINKEQKNDTDNQTQYNKEEDQYEDEGEYENEYNDDGIILIDDSESNGEDQYGTDCEAEMGKESRTDSTTVSVVSSESNSLIEESDIEYLEESSDSGNSTNIEKEECEEESDEVENKTSEATGFDIKGEIDKVVLPHDKSLSRTENQDNITKVYLRHPYTHDFQSFGCKIQTVIEQAGQGMYSKHYIRDIKPKGLAYSCSLLRDGQDVRQINGIRTDGMSHEMIICQFTVLLINEESPLQLTISSVYVDQYDNERTDCRTAIIEFSVTAEGLKVTKPPTVTEYVGEKPIELARIKNKAYQKKNGWIQHRLTNLYICSSPTGQVMLDVLKRNYPAYIFEMDMYHGMDKTKDSLLKDKPVVVFALQDTVNKDLPLFISSTGFNTVGLLRPFQSMSQTVTTLNDQDPRFFYHITRGVYHYFMSVQKTGHYLGCGEHDKKLGLIKIDGEFDTTKLYKYPEIQFYVHYATTDSDIPSDSKTKTSV